MIKFHFNDLNFISTTKGKFGNFRLFPYGPVAEPQVACTTNPVLFFYGAPVITDDCFVEKSEELKTTGDHK